MDTPIVPLFSCARALPLVRPTEATQMPIKIPIVDFTCHFMSLSLRDTASIGSVLIVGTEL
jgi:hypothetical protein